MKRTGIIYKATNKINGKSYVGQTIKGFSERVSTHKYDQKNKNFPFQMALRKYGFDNFEWSIIKENINIEKLDDEEKEQIIVNNTMSPFGYNVTCGGNSKKVFSEESRKKMSEYAKNRTQEHKNKLIVSRNGYVHSETTRMKISQKNKGKIVSKEIIDRISKKNTGKKRSEEMKKKFSLRNAKKGINKNNTSGFKGVKKTGDGWQAIFKGKRVGFFATPQEAAMAYDNKIIENYGIDNCVTNKILGLI